MARRLEGARIVHHRGKMEAVAFPGGCRRHAGASLSLVTPRYEYEVIRTL